MGNPCAIPGTDACSARSAVRVDSLDDPAMKRIFRLAVLALSLAALLESSAAAKAPPGIGTPCRRVGRIEGYWLNGPTRGPLYDYSSYFATLYPYLPNAAEYQWQATTPGSFGSAIAILPTSPPPARIGTTPPAGTPITPAPATRPSTSPPPLAPTGPGQATQTQPIQTIPTQSAPIQLRPIFRNGR